METLYSAENGIVREFTEAEYKQREIDLQEYLTVTLPANLRKERNLLLAKSDWTQGADSYFSLEQKTAWATYRQALRDLPTQSGFPTDVIWPTQP
jgi:Phage tail assembly chaperone protein